MGGVLDAQQALEHVPTAPLVVRPEITGLAGFGDAASDVAYQNPLALVAVFEYLLVGTGIKFSMGNTQITDSGSDAGRPVPSSATSICTGLLLVCLKSASHW